MAGVTLEKKAEKLKEKERECEPKFYACSLEQKEKTCFRGC